MQTEPKLVLNGEFRNKDVYPCCCPFKAMYNLSPFQVLNIQISLRSYTTI